MKSQEEEDTGSNYGGGLHVRKCRKRGVGIADMTWSEGDNGWKAGLEKKEVASVMGLGR